MKKTIWIVIAAIVILVFLIIVLKEETIKIGFENVEIEAEVADTPEERAVGLMNRTFLEGDEGMLFVFPDEQERNFWMKNTFISLDMIFLDKNKKITAIIENATPCHASPCPLYSSEGMYVIEVNAGFVEKNGISAGDTVRW